MNETAICLGPTGSLVGVYTEPTGAREDNAPAVLLLNAGITHRSGPFRIHVEVARRLASRGYACLRLDLAGIGDSAGRGNDVSEQEGTLADVRLAMDFLQSQIGTKRFVLFGLCSGADDSHQIALRDSRAAGIVALDAFAYPSVLRLSVRQFGRLAGHPHHVYQKARAKLRSSRICRSILGPPQDGPVAETKREERFQAFQRDFPPQDQVAAEIETLLDRGVQSLYIYSGGYKWYNYTRQFFDDFPNVRHNPRVEVEYFRDADHTYLLLADRERLIDRIETWLVSRFPRRSASEFQPAVTAAGPAGSCQPAIAAAHPAP
ncbi:MAG TPA: alpha/beta fold hydrolase [Planctomycetaceae bacterium]|jgi:pimeloyl-ACP methyl ester carboxylesterase|nr:alpha/beta fold hydrolase [Planctomycetaceae bacterium]